MDYSDVKIGMVTDSGTITDKSFNQGTWEGILAAEAEFGIAPKYLQPGGETTDDYLNEIGNLVDSGHGLIVTPGFKFEEAIFLAQDEFADTMFVLIDGEPHSADYSEFKINENVVSVFFAEHEAGFLAGVAAALESETGKIGFIGGMEIPPVQKFGWGFSAGVAYANANFGTDAHIVDYIYQGTFSEVDAGQQIAASMYDKGIDVIHAAAGGVGVGAINEAKTRRAAGENVWIVGVDVDQYNDGVIEDGSSVILTSAMKRIDVAAHDYIKAFLEGTFPGGQKIYLTAKDGGVGLPAENPNLSEETITKTNEVFAGLGDGSIAAPDSLEALEAFFAENGYVSVDGVNY
ncbi:MAG: BMP family ABC transporter substrate-binding protein [Clostridia bacterium]|nr:BMP family ABC transporter substrate-binding protein [Clostridia bacterium]